MNNRPNKPAPLPWGQRTFLMGILNLTPDSFSGDGLLETPDPLEHAVAQAREFTAQGADILDLGAESSRPGSQPVSAQQELERLLPALTALRKEMPDMILSVDTCKAAVAEACLEAGADWINDIWGLRADKDLARVVARYGAVAVLMHNRSRSEAVQDLGSLGKSYQSAHYEDFMQDVRRELADSLELALAAGIRQEHIILDPGIGFGKSVAQNLALINHLEELRPLGCPLLIGPSRKSFIGRVLDLPVEQREEGTAAAIAVGIARGADIVRVHNVAMMARVVRMADAIVRGWSSPA